MLNRTLLLKELRELRWALILGLVLLTGMALVVTFTYQMIQQYLPLAIDMLGEQVAREMELMMSSFDIYVWSQWNPKNLLQIGTLLAIILGSASLAGEVGRGSIDFLISRPLSRRTILIHKMLAGGIILSLAIWSTTLLLLLISVLQGLENWTWILGATAVSNMGLLVVYALAVLLSVRSSDSVKAGALTGAILLVYSGLGLLESFHRLSIFWHMKAFNWILNDGPFPWLTLAVFALLVIILGFLAAKSLEAREL